MGQTITEKILASIYATPMTYSEISDLPYLKTISHYGIDFSIETLIKRDFIIEKIVDRHPYRTEEYRRKYGEVVKVTDGPFNGFTGNIEKVNEEKMGNPSFLMVLTGGEYAYQRKDGVLVVPIGCLKD